MRWPAADRGLDLVRSGATLQRFQCQLRLHGRVQVEEPLPRMRPTRRIATSARRWLARTGRWSYARRRDADGPACITRGSCWRRRGGATAVTQKLVGRAGHAAGEASASSGRVLRDHYRLTFWKLSSLDLGVEMHGVSRGYPYFDALKTLTAWSAVDLSQILPHLWKQRTRGSVGDSPPGTCPRPASNPGGTSRRNWRRLIRDPPRMKRA
jgi:hypothetical protein